MANSEKIQVLGVIFMKFSQNSGKSTLLLFRNFCFNRKIQEVWGA